MLIAFIDGTSGAQAAAVKEVMKTLAAKYFNDGTDKLRFVLASAEDDAISSVRKFLKLGGAGEACYVLLDIPEGKKLITADSKLIHEIVPQYLAGALEMDDM